MEQETIKVALLQMESSIGNIENNIDKVLSIIKKELPNDCDVLVLPEVWTCGWSCKNFIHSAQDINNSSVLNFLTEVAKKYNINIIGGSFITKRNNKYYNSCPIINKKGILLGIYDKNHLYSYYGCDESKYITPGDNALMINLDGFNFGITICYDIRFPEIYRAYRKSGADILVNCAAWGASKPIPWEVMTKSRAVENQCYMLALTQCGHIENNEYNLGHSRIIDFKGEEISIIKEKEGIIYETISKSYMYDFRNKCTILNDLKDNYEVKVLCERY